MFNLNPWDYMIIETLTYGLLAISVIALALFLGSLFFRKEKEKKQLQVWGEVFTSKRSIFLWACERNQCPEMGRIAIKLSEALQENQEEVQNR